MTTVRMGGGIVAGKFGKKLNDGEAAVEAVVYGVKTMRYDRFGAPDFGTNYEFGYKSENGEYTGGLTMEGPEAVAFMQTEAINGILGEAVDLVSLSTYQYDASRPDFIRTDAEVRRNETLLGVTL